MALQPFYWSYDIDDSAIKCNSVIVADCDGTHRYKTVCDLMRECLPPQQLTNQCIVDFFNSDLSNRDWQYIKIKPDWCLTTWTPDCPCDDRKVAATNWDTSPDTLDKKIVGSCNQWYCIEVETVNSRLLQLKPTWPHNWFTAFSWTPTCDDAEVKMKRDWSVYVVCPEVKKGMRFAFMRHLWWSCDVQWNTTPRISAPNEWQTWEWKVFSWWWVIQATDWFVKWTWNDVIWIQEPGLYQFSYDTYVRWNKEAIYAIRAWLLINWMELWDFKYNWPWRNTRENQDQYKVINHMYPSTQEVDWWAMSLFMTWASFTWSYLQVIENASKSNPVYVRFQVKPDTRTFDPRMTVNAPVTTLYLTDSTAERGPFTYISILKVADDPNAYGFKTL